MGGTISDVLILRPRFFSLLANIKQHHPEPKSLMTLKNFTRWSIEEFVVFYGATWPLMIFMGAKIALA